MTVSALQILIVCPQETCLARASAQFERLGHRCTRLTDADGLAERVAVDAPDLVVLDARVLAQESPELLVTLRQALGAVPSVVIVRCQREEALPILVAAQFEGQWESLEELVEAVARQASAGPPGGLPGPGPARAAEMSLERFLTISQRHLAATLANINALARRVSGPASAAEQADEVCQLLSCPKLDVLTEALIETVEVLDRTRHAFKSKELGQLRLKLQGLLRGR